MSTLIDEINQLARLSRERPLTIQEKKRQAELRQKYLKNFRQRFKKQLSQIKVVDPKGKDITPKKAKALREALDQE
ncbi:MULTISPECIES: DUF896 domain-containing protein [Sporolactobacillus]|uniref:UPF0291 protein SAMN02982927_03478 n=1 Tax=Sporolactobacillus nakayamae TaxID=269670 RepID=A0A1I2WDJ2_9BACL|nr:DUF896 domain-containing protein [Sporolactobacillus nakayamae]SFG98326.1 Uncharacterized protein YnzC, UPF0291/DUF896 family [Sporolactobacillus nakayamae]